MRRVIMRRVITRRVITRADCSELKCQESGIVVAAACMICVILTQTVHIITPGPFCGRTDAI